MSKLPWMPSFLNRSFAYGLLWLIQAITLIQTAYLGATAWTQAHLWGLTADEDIQIIKTKLIPHLNDNGSHYQPVDVANMCLVSVQSTRLALLMIDKLLIASAIWFSGFIIVSLALYWLFPDRRALRLRIP